VSFYSPIDRLAQTLPRPKGTGAEFMTELSKMPGYKSQEAEDRGLQALMNLPKMERAQFLAKLKAHRGPPVEESTFAKSILRNPGLNVVPGEDTHHEQWTLPGGTNYREILLKHGDPKEEFPGEPAHFGGEPNILASIRAKDRVGPNGEKILHLEEIQSDWHQQGREKGYNDPKEVNGWKVVSVDPDNPNEIAVVDKNGKEVWSGLNKFGTDRQVISKIASQMLVPDAPFKKNWHELALKKMIHHAAANGYDSIAITPGQEQADRYGLAQHIGVLSYDPERQHFAAFKPNRETAMHEHGATPERVSQLVGKELAQKLMASPRQGGFHYLEGDDIKVGGEGMKGFYDKIVPNFLNQFGKKYGAKVGQVKIPGHPSQRGDASEALGIAGTRFADMTPEQITAFNQKLDDYNTKTLHHFPITPAMREDVTKNGVPLYAKGGGVEVKPTVKDETIQRKIPEMEEAAKALQAGTITRAQYDKVVKQHKPVKPYEFVPQPATDKDAERALMANKKAQWRGHEQWPAGRKVGLRLDIPAYENHGVWVNSIHDEEGNGEDKYPTAYNSVSSVKNATFDAKPEKAVRVATGEQNKSPFARIHGELHHMTEDEAVEHMKAHLNHPDYVQVGMDPRRHGYFYDRKTMKPITHSAHVVQIGPLVLAHKPTYGKRETYAKGGEVSRETAMGINVRSDKKANLQYADLIVDGQKTYESRNGDTLRPYVGKRVSIVRTGDGPAKAIGAVTVGEPIVVDRKKFRKMEKQHLVPEGSAFDIASGTKHLYPMHEPERYESERDVGHGIVARKVHMADGGPVPPLRPLSPQLAALREQMAQQSALHKAYNEAMTYVNTNQMPTFKDWVASQGKAKGGSIKPVGYTKERVTVSPSLDSMKYELMSVKRYTKKVK